jgi:hypothetical protein
MPHFPSFAPLSGSNEIEPLAVTLSEAERITGLARVSLYRANARNELIFIKARARTLVDYKSLRNFIQQLPRFHGRTGLGG